MSNPDHVAVAKGGTYSIARWRERHFRRRERLDLSGAYLSGARLPSVDLAYDDLSGADLTSADLRRSNLTGANLLGDQIWIEDHKISVADEEITTGPRVGIDYADEDAARPYRFVVELESPVH